MVALTLASCIQKLEQDQRGTLTTPFAAIFVDPEAEGRVECRDMDSNVPTSECPP